MPRLALLVLALCFVPEASARKDLFGAQQNETVEAKSDSSSASSLGPQAMNSQVIAVQPINSQPIELPPPPEPEPTVVELHEQAQKKKAESFWGSTKNGLSHLRDELVDMKDRLIGKPKAHKESSTLNLPQNTQIAAPEYTAYETKLSPTDAVKRALLVTDGKVINLRKYQEDEKTLYSVKLLQKNGRMRSVVLDANTGDLLEDANEQVEE